MTSRLALVIFKMADKVVVEEAVKNMEFARKIQSDFLDLEIIRFLLWQKRSILYLSWIKRLQAWWI